ncbi:MAG: hypothetical protein ACI9DC_004607 [Gammaproteobacteria bacterium]|jgi:hypothetical protein
MADKPGAFIFWHGVFLLEGVAAVIAAVSTVVPARTGSRNPIAELFFEPPTLVEKVLVGFVMINLIALLVGLVGYWFWRRRRGADGVGTEE